MAHAGQGTPAVLSDYREHHTDMDVHFSLQLAEGQMEPALATGLLNKFKLSSKISIGAGPQCASIRNQNTYGCVMLGVSQHTSSRVFPRGSVKCQLSQYKMRPVSACCCMYLEHLIVSLMVG